MKQDRQTRTELTVLNFVSNYHSLANSMFYLTVTDIIKLFIAEFLYNFINIYTYSKLRNYYSTAKRD